MKKITFLTCLFMCFGFYVNAQNYTPMQLAETQAASEAGSNSAAQTGKVNQNRNALADIIPTAGATETFAVSVGDFVYDPSDGTTGGPGGDCTTTSSGDLGDYPNCGCVTTTTYTGTDLQIEFSSFNIFGNFDFLNIYDGTDTASPQLYDSNTNGDTDTLAGMITENGSALFVSTTGALTFEFSATAVVNSCGWEAEVTSAGGGMSNQWTVNVMGPNFGDEVSWELRDNTGAAILSGGAYPGSAGYDDTQMVDTMNEPLEFFIESEGTFADNTPTYTVSCGGNVVLTGTLAGGEISTNPGLVCGGGGMPMCFTTDSTAVPFDIDGAGNSTADCAAAPNLIPVTITETGVIGTDYNIQTVTIDILHTFAADLDLALVAPDGTMIVLAEDLGGGTDDAYNGTQFQDGGADISAATAPFGVGPYEAQGGAFSVAFAGVDMNGDWQLQVCDDAGGDTGAVVQFSIEFCPPGAAPTNDECDFAINVECGDVIAGDTSDDTDSGGSAAPDEFYKYTGDGIPLNVTLSLCDGGTGYDSLIRVFTDCTLATEVASNDDSCGLQSELEFESDGVSTYYIMVEGFNAAASGAFSLAITCASTIDNDLCENAIEIDCGDTVTGTTTGALLDNDVAGATCGTDITAPGVWYVFEDASGLAGNVIATLCNGTDYDSKISVFSGDCSALVCIDGNDDDCGLQSTVTFPTDGATTFYILVHGFAANTGNFTLDLTCMPTPPPNDMIANSIDVDEIGFPYTDPAVAMPAATLESGDPSGCSINGSAGVWYNFVSAGAGTATASITSPGGASTVIFYSAPDENASETDLLHVDQFDNQCLGGTSASIFTEAGQAYYVFVVNTGAITDIVIDGTLLGSSDNTIEGFTFYPNPASNLLNVTAQNTIDSVSLFNVLGQKVLNQNVGSTSSQLDVSSLSTGTYIMKVSVQGEIGTYKVIKQ